VPGYTFGDSRSEREGFHGQSALLKADEPTYLAAEKIRKKLKVPRTRTFAKQLSHYNALYAPETVGAEYRKASRRLGRRTEYLRETELLEDLPIETMIPQYATSSGRLKPSLWHDQGKVRPL